VIATFDSSNFHSYCDKLAKLDKDLNKIILLHGYPPLWNRKPTFETLIHIILEQQVSLASAKAALNKLKEKVGTVTPQKILALNDAEMKACYFSRQKTVYARHLAETISNKHFSLTKLKNSNDDEVAAKLKSVKGIGDWTVDVFLMMALNRTDRFPVGDIALIKSIKQVKDLPAETTKEKVLQLAEAWKPYRTIAAYLLWHSYLSKRKIN
jgi:DNA-3-methyladenine glycosylase II